VAERGFEPAVSEASPALRPVVRRMRNKRRSIPFKFLVLLSLSCCALFRVRAFSDGMPVSYEAD